MDPNRLGTPVTWVDLGTTDVERSRDYYHRLFDWAFSDLATDEGTYTTALLEGDPVGGMMAQPEGSPSELSSVWTVFFATDDLDADLRRVAEAGGSVVQPPLEIPGGERVAVVADPTGAVFALATFAAVGAGRLRRDQPGSLCWVECHSRNVELTAAFLGDVFGWESTEDGPYRLLEVDGQPVAGLMTMPDGVPDQVPSYWFTYWRVDDLAVALDRAVDAGGSVVAPAMALESGRGAFAAVEDPTGAMFGLLEGALGDPASELNPHDRPVDTITSSYVISTEPESSLRTVIERLFEGNVSFVVVAESGSVAGVVSEHDVLRAVRDGIDIDEASAAEIMSTELVTAEPSETIGVVARRMLDNRVRHLLVFGTEGGVVSIRDVLDAVTP